MAHTKNNFYLADLPLLFLKKSEFINLSRLDKDSVIKKAGDLFMSETASRYFSSILEFEQHSV